MFRTLAMVGLITASTGAYFLLSNNEEPELVVGSETMVKKDETPAEKVEKYYRLQEELRNEYNEMGALYRAGRISESEWEDFRKQNRETAQKLAEIYTPIRDAYWTEKYGFIDFRNPTTSEIVISERRSFKESTKWTKEELKEELESLYVK